jgi:hypothetical protein
LLRVHLTKRSFLALLLEYSVIFSWASVFIVGISDRHPHIATWSSAAFSLCVAFSIFLGIILVRKKDTHYYAFRAWYLISPIITLSLIFASDLWFLIAVCLLGCLYGALLLGFFVSFGSLTMIRERGRAGGFIGFISIHAMSLLTVVSLSFGFVGSVAVCSLLGLCTFFADWLVTRDPTRLEMRKTASFKMARWTTRDFFLYLMPWLIYNLVNAISGHYQASLLIDRFQIPIMWTLVLSDVASSIGALTGGFVADVHGRKKALSIGLTSYGISSAFIGLIFSGVENGLLVFSLLALDGFSWGIFLVLYFFVVWEDLSNINDVTFPYAGIVAYPLIMGLARSLTQPLPFTLSSLALVSCVLIFSSNIFLVGAQELLYPKLRKETDILGYLEQVKTLFRNIRKAKPK